MARTPKFIFEWLSVWVFSKLIPFNQVFTNDNKNLNFQVIIKLLKKGGCDIRSV